MNTKQRARRFRRLMHAYFWRAPGPAPTPIPPWTPLDNFTRAGPGLGADWVTITPGWQLNANRVDTWALLCCERWAVPPPIADYYVKADLGNLGGAAIFGGLGLRIQDANNWYSLVSRQANNAVELYCRAGGVDLWLAGYGNLVWPQTCTLTIAGNVLVANIGGAPQAPVIDGTHAAAGFAGICNHTGNFGDVRLDSWSAGL